MPQKRVASAPFSLRPPPLSLSVSFLTGARVVGVVFRVRVRGARGAGEAALALRCKGSLSLRSAEGEGCGVPSSPSS